MPTEPEPAVATPLSVFFAASSEAFFFAAASSAAFFFTAASSAAFFAVASSAAFFPAASSAAFFATTSAAAIFLAAASSAAFFFSAASYAASFAAAASAASFAAVALVAATVSPAVELPLDPLCTIASAAADEADLGAGVAGGGPSAVHLPRPRALIRLYSGSSSLDDTLSSLWTTHTTFHFPLLGVGLGAAPPWPPAAPTPGIFTPRDWSPLWIGAMPTSSIEGIATNSIDLMA
jgi:hypothetical protein